MPAGIEATSVSCAHYHSSPRCSRRPGASPSLLQGDEETQAYPIQRTVNKINSLICEEPQRHQRRTLQGRKVVVPA